MKGKPYKHIYEVTCDLVDYVLKRKSGKEKSLKTRWKKFNETMMGGLEPNTIVTIGGISGSGKTALGSILENDCCDLNKDQDVIVLSFSFEMLSTKQVGRKVASKMKISTRELYSLEVSLSDSRFDQMKNVSRSMLAYPIYYVDEPKTVQEIYEIIRDFQTGLAKGKWLVVFIDHTLLILSDKDERSTINDLERELLKLKKIGKTTIVQLSQLNREIERPERINNPQLHYPTRSDISTSDSMYHASDYVIAIHRPEQLGISAYGLNCLPTKDFVYIHFLKNREGEPKILRFINDLAKNNLIEPEANN